MNWTNRPATAAASGASAPNALVTAGAIWGLDASNSRHMALLTLGFLAFHLLLWTVLATISHRAPPWDNVEQLVWMQSLEWGYYKHPPFPTWWVHGWTSLLGRTMWVLFFAAQLSVVLMLFFVWRIALMVTSPARAFAAIVLTSLLIYHGVHGIMANHNTLQLMPVGLLLWLSLLAVREQQVIANVFELDTRLVNSVMTSRDRIAWFQKDDPESVLRARIVAEPFSAYPICDGDIDHVLGYVDAKDMFQRVLSSQPLALDQGVPLHKALVVFDRLSLTEVLEQFRQAKEDFAIVVNEYSLVVGVITLNDVMSTVMGDLVSMPDEEQIVKRDENSWLIDGVTPIQDVQRALHIDELPHSEEYETLAGFLMVMLRRVPKRTDSVTWGGYTFEVMDVDSYRIDQVMVTRAPAKG